MKRSLRVTLRLTTASDWALIARWLARPDIRRWWANHASSVAGVRLALATPSAISRVIEVDGISAGYGHAIDAACLGEPFPKEMPAGTWDAGLFIADPRYRGRGVGLSALDLLTEEVFATTLALAVSVFVPVQNETAVRLYERAGFRWAAVRHGLSSELEWMLLRERR